MKYQLFFYLICDVYFLGKKVSSIVSSFNVLSIFKQFCVFSQLYLTDLHENKAEKSEFFSCDIKDKK